ncbi:MAG: bacillithiol biosynthesis cysteine-adding enzyme BshC [Candidatus Zixiibacteriota bacterium]
MRERLIPFSSDIGFSRLYREFIETPENIAGGFGLNSLDEAINAVSSHSYHRDTLVDILTRQNTGWGAGRETLDNIARLKDDKSVVVITGQQACLFGGPYLVILKALGVIKKAAEIERKYHISAIPVFWIAADDHDFAEISFAEVFDIGGKLQRVSVDVPDQAVSPPVGELSFDESIEQARQEFLGNFPENDFRESVTELINRTYARGEDITGAFAGLMNALLGKFGLVLFSPYDADFKARASGVMQDIVKKHDAVKDAVARANRQLDSAGYHQQVVKADTAVHLFAHTPNRMAVHVENSEYSAGDTAYEHNELISAIEEHPLDFSPDVLTRPIIQSAFFPAVTFIGGPAEVAYFLQLSKLFNVFNVPQPELQGRPSVTLIESRFEMLMSDEHIAYVDLITKGEQLLAGLVTDTFPDDVQRGFNTIRELVRSEAGKLDKLGEQIDKSLVDAIIKSRKNIDKEFAELHKRFINAHKKQNRVVRERLERLYENLYPRRQPAERVVNILYFLSRYGVHVIDFLLERLTIDAKGHQLLMMSEYDG